MQLRPAALLAGIFSFVCLGASAPSLADDQQVVCKGYGRMLELTEKLVEAYKAAHPGVNVQVAEAEFQGGAACLGAESCTIAAISRRPSGREIGRLRFTRSEQIVSVPIAMDALVFLVHPTNPLESLTIEQIEQIYTGAVRDWPEIGVSIPDLEPGLYSRIHRPMLEEHTGALDVLEKLAFPGRGMTRSKEHFPDSRAVVKEVGGDILALGLARMDYPQDAKVVPVSQGRGSKAVVPTAETIQAREYPLAHYHYWCFAGLPTGLAKDLLEFATSPDGQAVVLNSGLGFVPLPTAPGTDEKPGDAEGSHR